MKAVGVSSSKWTRFCKIVLEVKHTFVAQKASAFECYTKYAVPLEGINVRGLAPYNFLSDFPLLLPSGTPPTQQHNQQFSLIQAPMFSWNSQCLIIIPISLRKYFTTIFSFAREATWCNNWTWCSHKHSFIWIWRNHYRYMSECKRPRLILYRPNYLLICHWENIKISWTKLCTVQSRNTCRRFGAM